MAIPNSAWRKDYPSEQAGIHDKPKKIEKPLEIVGMNEDGSFIYGEIIKP
ncbi:hypothetical protein LZG74_25435 [Dyadobacter sp. CY327]|nr:hypothetical protein [Dyadobacter sp. CY327]MCE7073678.1 hypothetical protein [Dyadobacter sp. CY327]